MALHLLLGLLILSMAGHSSASFCVCKPGVSPDMMQKAIDYACGAGADCGPINPNGKCYNPNSITAHCSYAVNSYFQKNAAKGATCDFQGVATQTNSDPSGGGCSYSASSGGSTGSTTGSPTSPVTNVPTSSPTTPTTTPVTPVSGSGGTPTSGGTPGVTPVSGSGGTPMSGSGGTPVSGGTGGTGTGGMGGGTGTGGIGTNPTTASPYTASPNAGNGVFGGVGTGLAPAGSYDDSHAVMVQSITVVGSIAMALTISTIMFVWN